jgi:formylglycine-generating enzyme required for sulfatase activity
MHKSMTIAAVAAAVLACVSGVRADVVMDWITVGDPGNAGQISGSGAPGGGNGIQGIVGDMDDAYNISKYEVTAGQYTEFLNAVSADDTHGLYGSGMWTHNYGCKIEQAGSSPNYTYTLAVERADRPVNFVDWYDTLRFANWMHNGQPTGAQGPSTTEDGAYDMSLGSDVVRKPGAQVFLPTENEWYKAAYYKSGGTDAGYWIYPTSSDSEPGRDMTEVTNAGNNVNRFRIVPEDPFPIDPPFYQTVAGEFELSVSPYGTFDQGGNVWEWTEIWIPGSSTRLLRGGSFADEALTLKAGYRAYDFPPSNEHQYYGFRVAGPAYPSGVDDGSSAGARLSDCRGYPNPFNPKTEIRFTLSRSCHVLARVFDAAGRGVATLHEGELAAGDHRLAWNGADDAGRAQPSGLYVCRVEADGELASPKLLMLK